MTARTAQAIPAGVPASPGTAGGLLRAGVALLRAAGVENAEREAGWILEAALSTSCLALRLDGARPVAEPARGRAWELLARRAAREPLQHVLGTQEFCGLEFLVGPAVLIPRPETELLVAALAESDFVRAHPVIADIGTGSGCIAIALARAIPGATVYATDVSPGALRIARENAAWHGVADRVRLLEGDLCRPLETVGLRGRCGAIVSNPPYIPDGELVGLQPEVGRFEPRLALAGGPDGLAVHRRLLIEARTCLMPEGLLVLEVGRGQADRLRELAEADGGYRALRSRRDAAGIERAICFERR